MNNRQLESAAHRIERAESQEQHPHRGHHQDINEVVNREIQRIERSDRHNPERVAADLDRLNQKLQRDGFPALQISDSGQQQQQSPWGSADAAPSYGARRGQDYAQAQRAAAPWNGGFGSQGFGDQQVSNPFGMQQQPSITDGAYPSYSVNRSKLDNVRTIVSAARDQGVDPTTAVAAAIVESGLDHRRRGDHNTSFGLFQLHRGGELTEHRLTPQQAFDPEINARAALSHFQQGQVSNPGAMAAAAQRPAHRAQYAMKVNRNLGNARALIEQAGLEA